MYHDERDHLRIICKNYTDLLAYLSKRSDQDPNLDLEHLIRNRIRPSRIQIHNTVL
jgi:hypothetical protein